MASLEDIEQKQSLRFVRKHKTPNSQNNLKKNVAEESDSLRHPSQVYWTTISVKQQDEKPGQPISSGDES